MKRIFKDKKLRIVFVSFLALFLAVAFLLFKNNPKNINLTQYTNMLNADQFSFASLKDDEIILVSKKGQFSIIKDLVDLKELSAHVPINIIKDDFTSLIDGLIVGICFAILILFFMRLNYFKKQENYFKSLQNMAHEQVDASFNSIKPTTSHVKFSQVAGIGNVAEELTEIVDFLKNPSKYKDYGITLPKGILLIGPPGVGKTLIAKAIAGETKLPFFYQSGASFVQIYVGMGAKKVRELFLAAKAHAPSIIFIDEIDAVGKARGGMRNDEREATLNQLLIEIDGFEQNSNITLIAATNRIEMIDEALLRSGRFDRRIFLSLPNLNDRFDILNIYLKDKPCDLDVMQVAKMSVGFSGAALATFVNEAAINALREKRTSIILEDFSLVRDKVLLGKKKAKLFNEHEKQIQAVYQSAKALMAFWFDVDFDKIMLLGSSFKQSDDAIESKTQIFSKIKVYLAGMVACEMIYKEVYSNSSEDIAKARNLASMMVNEYAMSGNLIPREIDIENILNKAISENKEFIINMQDNIQKLAILLTQTENISKNDIKNILDNNL